MARLERGLWFLYNFSSSRWRLDISVVGEQEKLVGVESEPAEDFTERGATLLKGRGGFHPWKFHLCDRLNKLVALTSEKEPQSASPS